MTQRQDDGQWLDWLEAELADTLDEDYELELSEPALSLEVRKIYKKAHPSPMERNAYFHGLMNLMLEGRAQEFVDRLLGRNILYFCLPAQPLHRTVESDGKIRCD